MRESFRRLVQLRPRVSLRAKLLVFALVIAALPLLIAGRAMISIAQDELKSSANDQLLTTVGELTEQVNSLYERTWLAPLSLLRNAIDDEGLGIEEKISLLTLGLANVPGIVALQITVEDSPLPMVMLNDGFADHLAAASLNALDVLRVSPETLARYRARQDLDASDVGLVPETGDWLATIVLPLATPIVGHKATLTARIDLGVINKLIEDHPFAKTGSITVVDGEGRRLFDSARTNLKDLPIVADAVSMLGSHARTTSVQPYRRPDGELMLGAFSFPRPFDWAIIAERREQDAYLAITQMVKSLVTWGLLGVVLAIVGAILLSLGISRPILAIGRVAGEVTKGNLRTRVVGVRSKDEIGDLAERMNAMIVWLNEHLQLQKFVSGGTMAAIRGSDADGMKLGGQRRKVTLLFSDIRGYTAFSERVKPEEVVETLNLYLQRQADIVVKHKGDIDKFVGDQIVAVFQGERMAVNAVRAALEIQAVMAELIRDLPQWGLSVGVGINRGTVIVGAMGSTQRMDFTVLGDPVNLAARLCSHAKGGQTLVADSVREAIGNTSEFNLSPLPPIVVKGKSQPIVIYEAIPIALDAAPEVNTFVDARSDKLDA